MRYVDAHTHMDGFSGSLDSAIERIERYQIHTLAVSVDIPGWDLALDCAGRCALITPAFGVHPNNAENYVKDLSVLDAHMRKAPVIGEIGLCGRWTEYTHAQHEVFEYQLAYAVKADVPVNIHTADKEAEVLSLLRRYGPRRALIHWYSGPKRVFDALCSLGCYFSVSVDLLTGAADPYYVNNIPRERILTETDGPEALEWLGGGPAMPDAVCGVAKAAAESRGEDPDSFLDRVLANYRDYLGDLKI
jgi:TatD DNase family protein